MIWKYSDGGRSKYFKGINAGDCVCRAISIAENKDYKDVYNMIKNYVNDYRQNVDPEDDSHPRSGISKPLINKINASIVKKATVNIPTTSKKIIIFSLFFFFI